MASIRIRTKVQGETLVLPELRLFLGKTVDIEVTERPDETAEAANGLTGNAADHRPSLAELSARDAGRDLERDAADAGMTVEEYLAFLADLDAHPLRTPGLSPAGTVRVNLVAAGRVSPLPLCDPDGQPA